MNPFDSINLQRVTDHIGQTLSAFGESHVFGRDALDRDFIRNSIAGYLATLKTRGAIGLYDVSEPKLVKRTWEDIYPNPKIRERAIFASKTLGSVVHDEHTANLAINAGVPYRKRIDYYVNIYDKKETHVEYLGSDLSDAELDLEYEILSDNSNSSVGLPYAIPSWVIEIPGEYHVTDVKFRPTQSVAHVAIVAEFPAIGDVSFTEKKQ